MKVMSMIWPFLFAASVACGGAGREPDPPAAADTARQAAAAGETPTQGPMLLGITWRLTELRGTPAPLGQDGKVATMELMLDEKRVVGFAGCNRMTGSYVLQGDSLRLGPLILTRMACAKGMDLEQGFVAALGETRAYRLSSQGLELLGGDSVLARLEAQ